MACSSCNNLSHYVYRITEKVGIEYCERCLPKFLEERKKAGLLETTNNFKSIVEEGLKNITSIPVVETVEDTDSKKKAPKKKAE